jgi:hypothetical protein
MKKIALLVFMLVPFFCVAQQDSIKKSPDAYCILIASEKLLSNKVNVRVDYGHFKDRGVKDESGEIGSLDSIVDALNFMSQKGWKFVNAYPMTLAGSNVYHYVLKRELPANR